MQFIQPMLQLDLVLLLEGIDQPGTAMAAHQGISQPVPFQQLHHLIDPVLQPLWGFSVQLRHRCVLRQDKALRSRNDMAAMISLAGFYTAMMTAFAGRKKTHWMSSGFSRLAHSGGFEPPTARFVAEYSIQLSYECVVGAYYIGF